MPSEERSITPDQEVAKYLKRKRRVESTASPTFSENSPQAIKLRSDLQKRENDADALTGRRKQIETARNKTHDAAPALPVRLNQTTRLRRAVGLAQMASRWMRSASVHRDGPSAVSMRIVEEGQDERPNRGLVASRSEV